MGHGHTKDAKQIDQNGTSLQLLHNQNHGLYPSAYGCVYVFEAAKVFCLSILSLSSSLPCFLPLSYFFLCFYLRFSFDMIRPVYIECNRIRYYQQRHRLFNHFFLRIPVKRDQQRVYRSASGIHIHKKCFKNEAEHIIIMMMKKPKRENEFNQTN